MAARKRRLTNREIEAFIDRLIKQAEVEERGAPGRKRSRQQPRRRLRVLDGGRA